MKFSLTILFALFRLSASAEEGEDVHTCACEAIEFDFKINCTDTATMLASLAKAQSLNCAKECTSPECEKHFLTVQTHHDYCPEEGIPSEIENGFHDFDEACKACAINRLFVEGAPDCPKANCEDKSGNDAYAALNDNECLVDCSTATCREHFFMLRSVHDNCPHDVLSHEAEDGLHTFEEKCAEQICNHAEGNTDQLVCDEDHDEHDHGDGKKDPSSAASVSAVGSVLFLFASIVLS